MKSDEISALSEDIRGLISAIQRGLFTNDVKCDRIEDTPCFEEWREHYAFPAIARAMFARGKVHLIEPLWMICKMQSRIERLRTKKMPADVNRKPQDATDTANDHQKEQADNSAASQASGQDDKWWVE